MQFSKADEEQKMIVERIIEDLLSLTNKQGHPNLNLLQKKLAKLDSLALSVKYFGYELARALVDALPVRENAGPSIVDLKSSPSRQRDMESEWVAHWCHELKIGLIFHRKLWEFAYVLQALINANLLTEGVRGLGFGCGVEPLPSYLAAKGVKVTITDLAPEESAKLGWIDTNQHTQTFEHAFLDHLVDRKTFNANAELIYVDMNHIPATLKDYDFCWSICALEHLGSIKLGLEFVRNSLETLKPGGVAIHTTEFNFTNDSETIDNWQTVLFQRKHFTQIAERLRSEGHHVAELDFDVGSKPMDRFIDTPPWIHDMSKYMQGVWTTDTAHLKLDIDGFASTCFGLIITKKG